MRQIVAHEPVRPPAPHGTLAGQRPDQVQPGIQGQGEGQQRGRREEQLATAGGDALDQVVAAERAHSIVRRRPSASSTSGAQSSSVRARVTSRQLRAISPARAGANSRLERTVGVGGQAGDDVEHRALLARADVVLAVGVVVGQHGEDRAHDVADVDVVARLGAVAVDRRLLAGLQLAAEDRDHARLAQRVLAGPIDVAQPHRRAAQAVQPPEQADVALGAELRLAVGRLGQRLDRLGRRDDLGLAVDRAAGRHVDDPRARPRSPRAGR